jgi:LacI family transcriptional regulator
MADRTNTPPKKQLVGVKAVAELANVAISSVSRVLTDHPAVSPEMRERVLAAAAQLGYEPDLLAQGLRRGASLSIGFVVRDISNPVLAELALGAETELSRAGYSMLLANSHGDADSDAAGINLFRRRRVDGLLLSLSDEMHEPTLAAVRTFKAPIVLIDRQLGEDSAIAAVLSDHASGVREAVGRMIELGHRRIGLVTGEGRIFPMRIISRVAEEICRAAGVDLIVESGELLADDGAAQIRRMFARDSAPTAILTSSNQILVGALHTLKDLGLRIPDDVSVITFDDIPLLDLLDPPIGVISRQPSKLGRRSANVLLDQLRGDAEKITVTVPTVFDPRGSLAPPPGGS